MTVLLRWWGCGTDGGVEEDEQEFEADDSIEQAI
jgi:hypothetical protein